MTEPSEPIRPPESDVAAGQQDKSKGKDVTARVQQFRVEIVRFDRVLVAMVLLLAFLLASFPARNSDYWLHLATGRFLSEGKYTFGTDPFAYTTSDRTWVNHSWLFDLLLYAVTMTTGGPDRFGGTVAVFLKAMAMAVLAGLLLRLHRPGQGMYGPAACVGLAMLVMSPRMTLQPISVSLLMIGLTLFFLVRDGKPEPGTDVRGWRVLLTASPRRLWVLPVLFALWANLDAWFILGPTLLGLYLLGEKCQQALVPERSGPDAAVPEEERTLTLVFFVGLAACLVNPHHVRVFSLPAELMTSLRLSDFHRDIAFTGLFVSPFERSYFTYDHGLNASGMAYFLLLVLGAVSLVLTRRQWRVWRLFVWSALAIFSAPSMQLVPLFAAVAGPITAMNFQDYAAARVEAQGASGVQILQLAVSARLLTILLGVILLLAAWPGWLGAHPGNPHLARRVGWRVEIDESLRETAYKLGYWRLTGQLTPADRGFNFAPELADYCAWFAPDQQGFLDSRLLLFRHEAAAYTGIRALFSGGSSQPGVPRAAGNLLDWQKVFRNHGVTHLIFSGLPRRQHSQMVSRLLNDPGRWTLLYLDGRSSIFGLTTKEGTPWPAFDLNPRAFGKNPERAPERGPVKAPQPVGWVESYLYEPPAESFSADQAAMYLVYHDAIAQRQMRHYQGKIMPHLTAAVMFGAADLHRPSWFSAASLAGNYYLGGPLQSTYPTDRDRGPPAALLLAARAARRGAVDNPLDIDVYLGIAESTQKLWLFQENIWAGVAVPVGLHPAGLAKLLREKQSPERLLSPWLTRSLGIRHVLRRVQELTALHSVLRIDPAHAEVHWFLFTIYWSMSYYDAALDHLRRHVRELDRIAGDSKELRNRLDERKKMLDDCERQVEEVRRHYEMAVAGLPSKAQAVAAFRPFGLPVLALKLLQQEDLSQFSPEEANTFIYLLLTLGKASDLKGQLGEQQRPVLGPFNYEVFQAILAAALGDYAAADPHLERAAALLAQPGPEPFLHILQAETFGRLQPIHLSRQMLLPFLQEQLLRGHQAMVMQQRADDLLVLRGLLALEVGDNRRAAHWFRQALEGRGPRYDFESKPIARRYLELLRGSGGDE